MEPFPDPHGKVRDFLRSKLGADMLQLGADDPLLSTGIIDSFAILELIAFLEEAFQVTIDPSRQRLTEFETINSIVKVVERARLG
jgi:acyl carrier protein